MRDRLRELRRLVEAATPGPWGYYDSDAIAALRNAADALLAVAEAASEYLAEMDNPAPCHVMRKRWREQMRDALKKLEETDGSV